MASATYKNWGGGTSDNQARSQHGAWGNCLPKYFLCPPPTALVYPLEFLFVFIYSVKEMYSTCCVVLDSNALNFCKFLKMLYKNFQNCFICFSNFPKVFI